MVAVLPLWPARRFLPFTALAIGSMVPDLPLFFPISNYHRTHATLGALTLCLPMGLVIYAVFELIMRRPLTELLPRWVRVRLRPDIGLPHFTRRWMVVTWPIGIALAIVIGALSHQFWDAFTHPNRWATDSFASLQAPVAIFGIKIKAYKLFQYASSLVGLPLLALLAVYTLRKTKPITTIPPGRTTTRQLVVGLFIILTPCILGLHAWLTIDSPYYALGAAITRTGATLFLGLLLYSLGYQVIRLTTPRPSVGR